MAGLMFVVCVPTIDHEPSLQRKSVSSRNASDDSLHNSDSTTNLKRTSDVPCKSPSMTSIEVAINMGDCRNGRNGRQQEEELSRIVRKKGMVDWAKSPQHEGDLPMEKMLDKVLKKMQVENAVWCAGESGRYYQVFFTVGLGDHAEEILRHLNEAGIGIKLNSVVSVMPCALYYQGKQQELQQQHIIDDLPNTDELDSDRQFSTKTSAWDKFVMSVRARLTVAQVVEGVKANANFTFDFLFLLTISSFVAAIGLVENSTVILVASMLISPLMGPIMAGTFGTVIEDKYLQKIGVLNEILGLLVCILVGFIFGLAAGLANEHWGNSGWPTEEMATRGLVRSLWVGVLVALASGAAVAVAVLVNNTASLVGVAISASLMPPAVNAGLLWALAFMDWLRPGCMQLENQDFDPNDTPTYIPVYSDTPAIELAVLGAVSLGLTFVNIVCIFIAGILVLKIKEVAPRNSKDEEQFWKHDVKLARDYNRTLTGQDADNLKTRLAEELACSELKKDRSRMSPTLYDRLQNMSKQRPFINVEEIFTHPGMNNYNNQQTWPSNKAVVLGEHRPSMKDLQNNMNQTLGVNNERNIDAGTEHFKVRRHSGGPWTLGKQQNTQLISGIVSAPSTASTSCNTIPNSSLDMIKENNSLHHPQLLSDSNTSVMSVDSHSEGENGIYVTGRSRFTITKVTDPVLHV